MSNPVVHFEMAYKDAKRVVEFYGRVFGWEMNSTGEAMGNYVIAHTTETDEKNMAKTPGAINGGFYPLASAADTPYPSVVISVPDLAKALEDIRAAGGKILKEPAEIPGIGIWASFLDSEGNRVSVLQPNRPN